ncbi:MAG: hypothetical protein KKD39_01495 [Candidatus Altiarchaeota archaeon]|nr:hypothetical protein [Candidatus Altiarchaeota archaeon]
MKSDEFSRLIKDMEIKKGTFIAVKTKNSVCTGYFLEACYKTSAGGFINLSGTRKIGQGRMEEDWFDHTYSVPIDRILDVRILDPPFDPEKPNNQQKL